MTSDSDHARKTHLAGIFSRAASTYDRVGPRFFSYFGRRLVELAEVPTGAAVLDVGCGRGAALFPAADHSGPQGRAIGIDLAAGMIGETAAEIRQTGLNHVAVQQMDAEHLAFADAAFDTVLCNFTIFFFPQLARALGEFYRVLKPGGKIGISTFASDNSQDEWVWDIFRAYLPAREPEDNGQQDPQEKVSFDTPEGVTAILEGAGFESIRVLRGDMDLVFADEAEWWAQQWSHGVRAALERVDPDRLADLKAELFAGFQSRKQADGIHIPMYALFTFGRKRR